MSFINDQPTVETSIYDYIEVNGRISKKLFEKIIIPKLESITQKDARIAELEQVITEMAEALEFYLHQQKDDYEEEERITRVHLSGLGEIKGTFKLYGKRSRTTLAKFKSIIEEARGKK